MNDQVVVHAQLVDQIGLAQTQQTIVHPGAWPQKVETRTRSFALPPAEWRHHQHASALNIGHNPRQTVGRLVALERGLGGALWGTWTSWDLSLLTGLEPWWVSAEATWKGGDADAREIELLGTAMVRATAAVCTKPATILVGDLASERDRKRWHVNEPARDRLERAAAALKRRRSSNDPIYVHDEIQARAMRRVAENGYRSLLPPNTPEEKRRSDWDRHGPGAAIEWSRHHGTVLTVR